MPLTVTGLFETLVGHVQQIAASVAQLVTIQTQRAAFEKANMIAVSDVVKIIDLYTAALVTDASNVAQVAALQAQNDALAAEIAEFNDPALQAKLSAALAAPPATIAPPDPNAPAPAVVDPTPAPAPVTPVVDPNAPASV